jgi:arylsulfatase A-like enzyme
MKRFGLALGVAVCLLGILTGRAPAATPGRPNIVFILADQWRAQATGYGGDPNVKTPNLDRLAASSVDFTHAISSMPVCSPCRASLLTGQRAITHGIFLNDAHLADDATTLAKVMAAAGYETGIIGKWHLNGRGRSSFIPPENRQGFAYWKVMECTHEYNHSFYYADTPQKLQWAGYDAAAQTADAIKYIEAHAKGEKPFMLCLWWGPPHNPYQTAPAKFKAMYDPATLQLRPNVPKAYEDAARKDLAGYYAHCSALDEYVGDLMASLKSAGVDENTIVIFSSDHGDMLFSNGFNRKQKPWDESIRVPMLWHYPAGLGATGKKLDALVASEDVMPTLLGLCGVAIPKSVEGLDYSGYLKGGASPNRDNAALISCVAPFAEWNRLVGGKEYRGVRTERYTYVRDLKGPWLLYDDEKDPYQQKNLLGVAEAAELQARLDALLNERLKSAGDSFEPGDRYLAKWRYKDRVNAQGALSTEP